MPGGMIPDQEPGGFAQFGQAIRAPLEKLGRDAALGAARDKASRHPIPLRFIWGSLLPEDPIASERFGSRVSLLPELFHQVQGMVSLLPGGHAGQGQATPPDLVQENDRPGRLVARPGDQSVSCLFFAGRADQGW
jgi:hypothetical protein